MRNTRIDLAPDVREKMIELLNARLADAIDLKLQAKQAHWNVKGANFIAIHELFDAIATRVDAQVDDLAERVTALGGIAEGTLQAVAGRTKLATYPVAIGGGQHVARLADAIAVYGKGARAAIDTATDAGDADTADIFTGISRAADKDLWFLEAHLEG
ncbi:starvation-inducible DNA-binding protein [Stella humosa]|uniref:Starvation-inducible DNA-binding protein n=1 Tax=Stella humosa TaxID=94 RepID=A0A3N1KR91_9PROT|nr:DNA starvation/stationary phase protection protein Dps [Stella humosa]ROP80870.1 starvation-inducible DNA-binding protein [Stella humosa]BBK33337.1 DNA starvation/stationary phase protection protein [Stella humosa]